MRASSSSAVPKEILNTRMPTNIYVTALNTNKGILAYSECELFDCVHHLITGAGWIGFKLAASGWSPIKRASMDYT